MTKQKIEVGDIVINKLNKNKYIVLEVKEGIAHEIMSGLGVADGNLKLKREDGKIGYLHEAEVEKIL